MPGNGPAGGKKVARFSVDEQGFSRVLPYAHEGQSCFSYPVTPVRRYSVLPDDLYFYKIIMILYDI